MLNHERSAFFDSQVEAPWADTPYDRPEKSKLERLFAQCGSLTGCTVLEPGCGTGRLTELLSRQVGPIGFVHACDISRQMVRKAQARMRGIAHVSVCHAAMEDLNLDQDSVDLIVCHQVFPHFDDKHSVLRFMAEKLKPGGALLITHFECREVINDVHRKAGTVVAYDMLPDRKEMEMMLNAAGLRIRYYSDDRKLGYLLKAF